MINHFNIEYFKLIRSLKIIQYDKKVFNLFNQWSYRLICLSITPLMVWTIPGLSFTLLYLIQMSKNNCQFIINLIKLPNGFAYDSVLEPQLPVTKKKAAKKSSTPNSASKSMNRIARQLALDLQQPPQKLPTVPQVVEQYSPPQQIEIPEEIQVEIRRQNQLPKSPAKWYNQHQIHDLQRKHFLQFFGENAKKSPKIYEKYRNFIVNLYLKNPNQYLTKIACRRILRGDVNVIMKIHTFLQKQGVINFGVSKDGNYTFISSIFQKVINPQTKYPNPSEKIIEKDQQQTYEPVDLTNLTVTLVNKNFSKGSRVYCCKCGMICGLIWYIKRQQNQEKTQNCLCCRCFQDLPERQGELYIKNDIVKKAEASSNSKQVNTNRQNKPIWNIDENLKLLQFSSDPSAKDWQQLKSQFQHKKSLDDILLQFMQFPISNFDESQNTIKPPVLSYPHQIYVNRLVDRFEKSEYNQKYNIDQQKNREQEIQNKYKQVRFQNQIQQVFKKLFEKYDTKIKYQMQRQTYLNNLITSVKSQAEYRKFQLLAQASIPYEEQNAQIIDQANDQKKYEQKITQQKLTKKSRIEDDSDYNQSQYSSDQADSQQQNNQKQEQDRNFQGQGDGGDHQDNQELNQMMGDICSG